MMWNNILSLHAAYKYDISFYSFLQQRMKMTLTWLMFQIHFSHTEFMIFFIHWKYLTGQLIL